MFPYIKPSNYRLVFTLYPVKRFIGSPQPAGTTACGLAHYLAREPVHKSVFRGIFQNKVSRYP